MKEVKVDLGSRSYDIHIGSKILDDIGSLIKDSGYDTSKFFIVTNQTVSKHYGYRLLRSIKDAGYKVALTKILDGEEYKTLDTANNLYASMLEEKLDRLSTVIALGGGVVGDIAGFAAATYMRGIPFIQVPTTLLAQVDSSVGGKVAVNHEQGKNIIGCFHQPKSVYIDVYTLKSLPEREYKAGLAEVIKYGIINDAEFFSFLEENRDRILGRDYETLIHVVSRSCEIKAFIVEMDEREEDLRRILNCGHTIGHAIENALEYTGVNHGEAVSVGTMGASLIAEELGFIDKETLNRIQNILEAYGLPVSARANDLKVLDAIRKDKKVRDDKLTFVLPKGIGQVFCYDKVPKKVLLSSLRKVLI